jgi:hypothetical protein
MEFSFATFDRELQDALRRKLALFGSGPSEQIYDIGPRRELLGHAVEDFPAATAMGLRAALDRPSAFDVVPARTRFVPAHVTAELHGPRAGQPAVVAIALNGRIAAVARSVPQKSGARLSAIVPESAFRPGGNRLQLLAVSSTGARTTLAPLAATTPPAAAFALRPDEIRTSGSRRLPIEPGVAEGFVDHTELADDGVRFSGWAAALPQGRPVERLLVFAGGALARTVEPKEPRPDIAELFGGSERNLGFAFTLSPELALHSDVELFALAAGRASRIPYLCEQRDAQVVGC